jgi:DNA-directed RNA polymerase specialized sigma24 family protein
MKVVPWAGGYDMQDEQGHDARFAEHERENGHRDAMRSWLVSGIHLFVVDPRRRFGGHGRARELLVVDRPVRQGVSESWQTLAAALHRHTVQGGLSQLSPEERRVITLAYLEGRTNREIAAMFGVSVSTVRRRLWVALQRLDVYLSRTGAWLSVFVLVVVAYAVSHAARLGRWVATAAGSADKAQRLAATLAAGAVTMAALGIVSFSSDSAMPSKSPPAATAPLIPQTAVAAQPSAPSGPQPSAPSGPQPSAPSGPQMVAPSWARPDGVALGDVATNPGSKGTSPTGGPHHNNGCDGNPTSAPPPVPVGSATSHPTGAPVTHPTAGGCKA